MLTFVWWGEGAAETGMTETEAEEKFTARPVRLSMHRVQSKKMLEFAMALETEPHFEPKLNY